MTVDNPEKYNKDGGLHLQRMTPEEVRDEGLDPSKAWIVLGVKEADDVKVCMIPGDQAIKVAQAIIQLVNVKL